MPPEPPTPETNTDNQEVAKAITTASNQPSNNVTYIFFTHSVDGITSYHVKIIGSNHIDD